MVRMVRVCGVEPATWSITHPFPVLCYRHSTRHVKQRTWQIPLAPPPSLWLYFHPRRVRLLVFLTPSLPKCRTSILSGQKRGMVFLLISSLHSQGESSISGATGQESWPQISDRVEVSCLEGQTEKTRPNVSVLQGPFLE